MDRLYYQGFLYSDLGPALTYKSTSASKPVFVPTIIYITTDI